MQKDEMVQAAVDPAANYGAVTLSLVEPEIEAVAALLLGTVNAPEQEIYRVSREIVERLRSQGGAPEGWKLVPVEPTKEMWDARFAADRASDTGHASPSQIYRAMLAAAPQPPASQLHRAYSGDLSHSGVQPPEGGTGWRDIASAPKDGTEVIGWRDDCGPILVRWTSAGDFLTDAEAEESGMTEEQLYEESWFYADFVQGGRLAPDEYPTHWMPLPSPPGQDDRTNTDDVAAANAAMRDYEQNGGVTLDELKDALPRKDVEGAAYSIGDRVEKYTGEATYVGTVVSVYLTVRRKLRYVVDVEPQRFQMISNEAQLRPAAIRSLGKPTGGADAEA